MVKMKIKSKLKSIQKIKKSPHSYPIGWISGAPETMMTEP